VLPMQCRMFRRSSFMMPIRFSDVTQRSEAQTSFQIYCTKPC
jgi:hypothetical protein